MPFHMRNDSIEILRHTHTLAMSATYNSIAQKPPHPSVSYISPILKRVVARHITSLLNNHSSKPNRDADIMKNGKATNKHELKEKRTASNLW